jgi:hypothetical protein
MSDTWRALSGTGQDIGAKLPDLGQLDLNVLVHDEVLWRM